MIFCTVGDIDKSGGAEGELCGTGRRRGIYNVLVEIVEGAGRRGSCRRGQHGLRDGPEGEVVGDVHGIKVGVYAAGAGIWFCGGCWGDAGEVYD